MPCRLQPSLQEAVRAAQHPQQLPEPKERLEEWGAGGRPPWVAPCYEGLQGPGAQLQHQEPEPTDPEHPTAGCEVVQHPAGYSPEG